MRHQHKGIRFLGNELTRVGETPGWLVKCAECERRVLIASNRSPPLAPDVVRRKLAQKGWKIGRKPADDLCPDCAHPPRRPRAPSPEPAPAPKPMRAETEVEQRQRRTAGARLLIEELMKMLRHVIEADGDLLKMMNEVLKEIISKLDRNDERVGAYEYIHEIVCDQIKSAALLAALDAVEEETRPPVAPEPTVAPAPVAPTPPKHGIPQAAIDRALASLGL